MELTAEQINQMGFLKQHYPYRIIYGVIDKNTNEFTSSAVSSMRIPNKLTREGHTVFIMNK
jgi:hypothetical protein